MAARNKEELGKWLNKVPSIGHLAHPCMSVDAVLHGVHCGVYIIFAHHTPHRTQTPTAEVGPSYVFLASGEATQFTGQVLHPNGGYIVNG